MRDYSRFPAPREVPVGGPIETERRRRPPNRNLTYAALGCALLCICAALALGAFYVPLPGIGVPLISFDSNSGSNAPSARASVTPTPKVTITAGQATPVPFTRSVSAKNGLKVSVTYYQRPLPIQGVTVPDGQELAVASLHLENNGSATLSIKPTDFYLVNADNEQYNPDKGGITTGTMLRAMDLKAGDIFEGDLVYFIRKDVGDLQLGWKSPDGVKLFALARGK